jgi:ubiquinone/menaquinone biosynthesis C-methylase UbiE
MSPDYIPAARWRSLSRLYDPVLALAMRERRFRCLMGERVGGDLPDGGTAVDVGCGTGTFAIALSTARPDARVIGVDGDPEILAIARGKDGAGGVEWRDGLAQELPPADRSADVVTMSLVLHHLLPDDKSRALEEARRVLRPGGRLHIADWGPPGDLPTSAVFYLAQALDGFDRTRDHREGRLPDFITGAGFGPVERYGRFRTAFGSLELLTARAEGTAD